MTDQDPTSAMSVETQLALLRRDVGQLITDVGTLTLDHEARIRKLEQFKWVVLGAAMTSAGGIGALASQLLK